MPRFSGHDEVIRDEPNKDELAEQVSDLGVTYYLHQVATDTLATLKKEFFDAATEKSRTQKLAQKTVAVPSTIPVDDARSFVEKYNPGWLFVEQRMMPNGTVRVIIREDPAFKTYSYVVAAPEGVTDKKGATIKGFHVTRTIRSGSPLLDNDRLAVEDKDLWYEVTEWPNQEALENMLYESNVEPDEVSARLTRYMETAGVQRVLKPLNDLDAKLKSRLGPYTYESPKTVALNVREAKDSELADL